MKPIVGFRRNVRLEWIESAATLAIAETPRKELRDRLEEQIRLVLTSDDTVRQTIDSLYNIWVNTRDQYPTLWNAASELYVSAARISDRVILHYGLTLNAYPFFRIATAHIGRATRWGQTVSTPALRTSIASELGSVGSLPDAVSRVIYTLRNWGMLISAGRSTYKPVTPALIPTNDDLAVWMVTALLQARGESGVMIQDLNGLPELFAIDVRPSMQSLQKSGLVTTLQGASGLSIRLGQ